MGFLAQNGSSWGRISLLVVHRDKVKIRYSLWKKKGNYPLFFFFCHFHFSFLFLLMSQIKTPSIFSFVPVTKLTSRGMEARHGLMTVRDELGGGTVRWVAVAPPHLGSPCGFHILKKNKKKKKKKNKKSKSNAWVVTAGRETLMVWLMVLWVKNW
jgi:hypothetical protein